MASTGWNENAVQGVSVFRLNFSHGTHDDHAKIIDHICQINNQYEVHIGIMADLQGPKLRIGQMQDNGLLVAPGDILTFKDETVWCLGCRVKRKILCYLIV